MTKAYTHKDIQVLTDFEHVRKRTSVYLGNTHPSEYVVPLFQNGLEIKPITFIPAVYKAVGEIIDNSVDELVQINTKNKLIQIEANPDIGQYTISDNGRGVPITKHESGKYTPEVVFGSLRSGRNFGDDREAGVIGVNGVGSSCVNALSKEFFVRIRRDKKTYTQEFHGGAMEVSKPKISRGSTKTGTEVSFSLDPEVFSDVSLPSELVHNRAIEIALTNPGISVEYNGKAYKFKQGFCEYVKSITSNYFKFKGNGIEFFILFGVNGDIDEKMFTWVNSSLLFDGGICNTQFLNAFVDKSLAYLAPQAKKIKADVTRNDVRQKLLIFGNLNIAMPQYDSQAKTRLTGPSMRPAMDDIVEQGWKSFVRQHKPWLEEVLEYAAMRNHAKANQKAIKEHQKSLRKKVPGLVDATHSMRQMCSLLVTEGLSAASMITDARDPKTIASYPLTGKVNNVYGTTPAQLLQMGKLAGLLSAVGLIPGKRALRSELRYGKLIIATDADTDGDDIFTLLVNLFYQFWPELFDKRYEPFVHRLVAPNICLVKGKTRIHFPSRTNYESRKGRYKGYEVRYYKGLGSMAKQDWEMILSGKTDTLIPIVDDGVMKETLKLLFGPDADARKDWLQES